ncbi:peptidoglycan editing factor PgeF [Alkalinema sp. FACHB-956]|uniref:peptidoglycan editing factor PgeF n=1 Tax=Alkalinema sp. FACHB-956 TaxID=2692768 RepID=UPI00168934DC|nr:peptidoglycan editing factor PgeF [Alkalinema sp. FACHB-956]MBD2325598.1 peptidoglycan editing factor PgeF [Alkalinema sp. FACHB-956]
MHTWHWQTWNDLPYLTCSLLEPWQHGWFTQKFAPKTPFELTAELYPQAIAYRAKQVHGDKVLAPAEMPSPLHADNLPDGDGVISQDAHQAVWVCTADCTPVLIGDVQTGQVAAVHAGWRGTAKKIVPGAIERLLQHGSQLANLRVAMGPAIAGEVYQVDTDVAVQTAATIAPETPEMALDEAIAHLQALPHSPVLPDPQVGKVRLNVRQVNALQLEQLGLAPEQIAISPHCTYQDPDNFFSHRRAPLRKAQWAGIVSRGLSVVD